MNNTKDKIVKAAIALFNEEGLVNVLNQDIAKRAGVSLSNFNYHFKTKKDLVFIVCDYLRAELKERVNKVQVMTKEGRGLDLSLVYFEFEKDYRFFYLDTNNILQRYPELKDEMQKQIKVSIQVIRNLNYMAIGKGYLHPEPTEMTGLYDHLAEQIWINSHYWLAQNNIRGREGYNVVDGMKSYYAICYPYLTTLGRSEYSAYIANLSTSPKEIT